MDGEGRPVPSKSAAILSDPQGNAVQIDGKYVLYANECVAYVVYGAGDKTTCAARVGFSDLLKELEKHPVKKN